MADVPRLNLNFMAHMDHCARAPTRADFCPMSRTMPVSSRSSAPVHPAPSMTPIAPPIAPPPASGIASRIAPMADPVSIATSDELASPATPPTPDTKMTVGDRVVAGLLFVGTTLLVTSLLLWLAGEPAHAQEASQDGNQAGAQAAQHTDPHATPVDPSVMVDLQHNPPPGATDRPEPTAMSEQEAQRERMDAEAMGWVDPRDDWQAGQEPASFSAAGCLPSGGVQIPGKTGATGEVVFNGGGWGHGAGMSQYGSLGAVRLGCDYQTILKTYFQGVEIQQQTMPLPIVVQVGWNTNKMTVTALEGTLPWQVCDKQGNGCVPVATQPKGTTFVGIRNDETDAWTIMNGETEVFTSKFPRANQQVLRVVLSQSDNEMRIAKLQESGWSDGRIKSMRWGHLDLHPKNTAGGHLGNITVTLPTLLKYLMGLGEVSSSWPLEAQKVQAVTARTFLKNKMDVRGMWDKCNCNIRGTTSDQYYRGWDHERWDNAGKGTWRRALLETSGQVMTVKGRAINAFYNAISGGVVDTANSVWGGTNPSFSKTVDDSRWELAAKADRSRWQRVFTKDELGAKLGIGSYVSHQIHAPLSRSGRLGRQGITFTGTTGSVTLTKERPRSALGLFSMFYRINEPLPPLPSGLIQGPNGYIPKGQTPAPTTPKPTTPQPTPPKPTAPTPTPPKPAAPVGAGQGRPLSRVAGPSRVDTAIAASRAAWKTSATVVIANANNWNYALAASSFAAQRKVPLLLTSGKTLEPSLRNELARLKPNHAVIVGAPDSVTLTVGRAIQAMGVRIERIRATDSYSIAAQLAAQSTVRNKVVLVSKDTWPDSVSATALANGANTPPTMFITKTAIPETTLTALNKMGAKELVLIGGHAVIAPSVEQRFKSMGFKVTRMSGSNRFLTSNAVANQAKIHHNPNSIIFVSAKTFADSLAAGPLASKIGGTVVMVPHDTMTRSSDTAQFLGVYQGRFGAGYVMGGTKAISPGVANTLQGLW